MLLTRRPDPDDAAAPVSAVSPARPAASVVQEREELPERNAMQVDARRILAVGRLADPAGGLGLDPAERLGRQFRDPRGGGNAPVEVGIAQAVPLGNRRPAAQRLDARRQVAAAPDTRPPRPPTGGCRTGATPDHSSAAACPPRAPPAPGGPGRAVAVGGEGRRGCS